MLKRILAASAATAVAMGMAQAQEIKVGVPLPFTGIGAELGQQTERGMELYLKLNADQVKPYKITFVKRDVKDPGGATAKTVVQELITQDKVDALVGWVYSPNAIASAPIVTAGNKLALITNAGTAHITTLSPNYVRLSFSMWHAGYAMGEATAKILKAKTAVIGYTDFPPGRDMRDSFKRAFEAAGGFDESVYAGEEVWLARRIKAWAKPRKLVFQILPDPVVTSARKSEWFSTGEFVTQLAVLFLVPWATRSRRLCAIWYRRPESAADPS